MIEQVFNHFAISFLGASVIMQCTQDEQNSHLSLFLLPEDRVDRSNHFDAKKPGHPRALASQYLMERADYGLTSPSQTGEAYMAVVHLQARGSRDMWRDGKHVTIMPLAVGGLTIHDLGRSLVFDLREPFQTVNFQIPRWLVNELMEDLAAPGIAPLDRKLAVERDEVMMHLALALSPALSYPREAGRLFSDQIISAATLHLMQTYGELRPRLRSPRKGLAPWQERRAKELLLRKLGTDVALADLAKACDLSVAYFSRAFKLTTGTAPHRWLTEQRIAIAKDLLKNTEDRLIDIALRSGFTDQSHFTRVFSKVTGASPGVWRYIRKN